MITNINNIIDAFIISKKENIIEALENIELNNNVTIEKNDDAIKASAACYLLLSSFELSDNHYKELLVNIIIENKLNSNLMFITNSLLNTFIEDENIIINDDNKKLLELILSM